MITSRNCPICGAEIRLCYKCDPRHFIVKDGKFVPDDIHTVESPYLDVFCSEDKEHNIEQETILYEQTFDEWYEEIYNEFYEQGLYD